MKFPKAFETWVSEAGDLDFSAMLTRFNLMHRFFFRNTLSQIRIDSRDIEKIRKASEKGSLIYMMRNWGPIEYNYFNTLLLQNNLPLATHANLTRMFWWMPLRSLFKKNIASLNRRYHDETPHVPTEAEIIQKAIENKRPLFLFLNLPPILGTKQLSQQNLILPILDGVKFSDSNDRPQIIPLTFIYDRRPGKEEKTLIDLLFGEKENPGALRKTVMFFRNHKKRAVAQVGDPIDLKSFIDQHPTLSIDAQANTLQSELHEIFFKEYQAITGPRLKSRSQMIERVLQNPELKNALRDLAEKNQQPLDAYYLEAEKILGKLVSDPNYSFIDFWSITLGWILRYVYDGVVVDQAGLARLKQLARRYPLVLVPSHRSHMDYFLISYIFYHEHLSIPLIAAGENLSFWPMGYLFRHSGAYFMRRSFGEDALYPLLFKAYVKLLIKEGYFQEFFIEGTRSRTGKLEQPRTGLLSIYLDCHLENPDEDLYLVPISINYEKVLEEKSYLKEIEGVHKSEERFTDLFKIRKHLQRKSGQVYVQFADPISLKESLVQEEQGMDSTVGKRHFVQNLAKKIAVSIEKVSIVTAPALVAAALLAHPKKGQSLAELFAKIDQIRDALQIKHTRLSDPLIHNYSRALHEALLRYKTLGILHEHHDGIETFLTIDPGSRHQLNYYKNSLIHHLIPFSLFALAQKLTARPWSYSDLEHTYQGLQEIFLDEFVEVTPFHQAYKLALEIHLIEEKDGELASGTVEKIEIFSALMNNFVEGYEAALLALKRLEFSKIDEKKLVRQMLDLGRKLLLKGDLHYPESLSQFTLKNALKAFKRKGIILSHENEMGKKGLRVYSMSPERNKLDEILTLLRDQRSQPKAKGSLYLLQKR